jgi:DNA-directed RNA polymerase specialized sigma24 family protein
MRVWDGLGFAEIAAITGKSEAGAKMAYSRIMAKLRTAIPHTALALAVCAQFLKHYY